MCCFWHAAKVTQVQNAVQFRNAACIRVSWLQANRALMTCTEFAIKPAVANRTLLMQLIVIFNQVLACVCLAREVSPTQISMRII